MTVHVITGQSPVVIGCCLLGSAGLVMHLPNGACAVLVMSLMVAYHSHLATGLNRHPSSKDTLDMLSK